MKMEDKGQGAPSNQQGGEQRYVDQEKEEQEGGEGGENKRMAKLSRNARSVRQSGDLHSPEHSPSQYELLFGWVS